MNDRRPPDPPHFEIRDEHPLPRELDAALASSPAASERFAALAPSHRREYVRWVLDARRADARERRAAQTVMRLLGAAPRNSAAAPPADS
ncbi:MAG: YdeI/OmpD-associated family protein [Thermoleophilia bacterium]|nr:YdeI/OmpD-associated family protein [Thermoleophilia bacterium]